jgi:hypothetical protein
VASHNCAIVKESLRQIIPEVRSQMTFLRGVPRFTTATILLVHMNALGRIAVRRSRSVPSSAVSAEHYYNNNLSSDDAAPADHAAMVSSSHAVTKNQHRRSIHNDISSSSYIYNFTNRDDDDDDNNNFEGETERFFQPRIKCESSAIASSSSSLLLFSSSVINRGGSANNAILQNRNQNTPYYTNYCQQRQQQQYYHTTTSHNASGVAIVMTLGAIAATAKAGQYAIQGYNEYKAESESAKAEAMKSGTWKEEDKGDTDSNNNTHNTSSHQQQSTTTEGGGGSTNANNAGTGAATGSSEEKVRENIFAKFFDMSVGSKYYEGGFEDKMSRKEAALILGVRESSSTKRIKEAHRKLLILNHPDTGGSTFLSGKINEAKELLLKGKKF